MKKYGSYIIEELDDSFCYEFKDFDKTSMPTFIVFKDNEWVCECLDFDSAKQVVLGMMLFDDLVKFINAKLNEFLKHKVVGDDK